jgi:hypothetical protein
MATQGVVSLVDASGKPYLKAVAGCGGNYAQALLDELRLHEFTHIGDVYAAALRAHFGCKDCLVVMNRVTSLYEFEGPLPPIWRDTFNAPSWNPRWKYGSADFVEVRRWDEEARRWAAGEPCTPEEAPVSQKIELGYCIYELREGLLCEPEPGLYESRPVFRDWYDTQEDAVRAIAERDKGGRYVILPETRWVFSHE